METITALQTSPFPADPLAVAEAPKHWVDNITIRDLMLLEVKFIVATLVVASVASILGYLAYLSYLLVVNPK